VINVARGGAFLRLFSSGVAMQALLSAANFGVGLLLIRYTSDAQYGSYILVYNAVLLLTSLQNAFIQPSMVNRLARSDKPQRAGLIGGLYREQRQAVAYASVIATVVVVGLCLAQVITLHIALLVVAAIAAVAATLYREFFRMVLLNFRLASAVLGADSVYVCLLVLGVVAATFTPAPAVAAVLALAFSAWVGGLKLSQSQWKYEPWNTDGAKGVIRDIAPVAMWSAGGAAVHWAFSQGYSYLVAGTLNITAVAAIGASRLLMMPINLLSSGIGSLMLPLAAGWLRDRGPAFVFRRLLLFAGGVAMLAMCYFAIMWVLRDWISVHVLKKQFAERDVLLLFWSAIFLVMVLRDQLIYLPVAQGHFRMLMALTTISAISSLAVSYVCMRHQGVIGALIGVLAGEVINVVGIVALSIRDLRGEPQAIIKAVAGTGGGQQKL
jgi:O-antigen/teichoic acid export membrane protein